MIRAGVGKGKNFKIMGIPEIKLKAHIYPNPTDGFIYISDSYKYYFLYNLSGKLMTHGDFNTKLDFGAYPNGLYLLKLQSELNSISQKILIER